MQNLKKRLFLGLLAASLAGPASLAAEGGDRILFLHFRWHQGDSVALVSRQEIKAQPKVSRARQKRGEEGEEVARHSALSYEWVYSDGKTSAEEFLEGYDERYVEFQEPGEDQLRRHSEKVEVSDIFLKVSDPGIRGVRFFKDRAWKPGDALRKQASSRVQIASFDLRTAP